MVFITIFHHNLGEDFWFTFSFCIVAMQIEVYDSGIGVALVCFLDTVDGSLKSCTSLYVYSLCHYLRRVSAPSQVVIARFLNHQQYHCPWVLSDLGVISSTVPPP